MSRPSGSGRRLPIPATGGVGRLARVVLAFVAAVGFAAVTPDGAGAIETSTWGMNPAPGEDGRATTAFHPVVRAGETTPAAVDLWNKTDRPITLRLSAAAAQVVDGRASLGGDGRGVSWIAFEDDEVTIPPGSDRRVAFEVRTPRQAPGDSVAVAILATPVAGEAVPAVMERLAIMAYLEPASSAPSPPPATLPLAWLAGGLLIVVVVAVGRRGRSVVSPRPA